MIDISKLKTSFIAKGRIGVYLPDHFGINNRGYVLRARIVMEQTLGRSLSSDEEVHHKDKNKLNDEPDNLEVKNKGSHTSLHSEEKRKLDYKVIKNLRNQNLGYKSIAKQLQYPLASVKSACRVLERG